MLQNKAVMIGICFLLSICTVGCSSASPAGEEAQVADATEIMEIYLPIYQKTELESSMDDLETVRRIVQRLGENGYIAIDSENQMDLTEAAQLISFCEKVAAGEAGRVSVIIVDYRGGFIKYDLETEGGAVYVNRRYYGYENGDMQQIETGSYQVDDWVYTPEEYLMFSGTWFLDALFLLTASGMEEHVAIRIQPLAEECRVLNRKYLLPIGYACNNMFLVDWSEQNFGALNFYDLYDIFYRRLYGQDVPYQMDENLNVGAVYKIPEDAFAEVIQTYLHINRDMLRSKTVYDATDAAFVYKPRGFYEIEPVEYPYSEVVAFTENTDGTITLSVQVVFPHIGNAKVYTHEVVVRPLANGGMQYVSNRILSPVENGNILWHTPRLTEEGWKEVYGEKTGQQEEP